MIYILIIVYISELHLSEPNLIKTRQVHDKRCGNFIMVKINLINKNCIFFVKINKNRRKIKLE